MKERINNLIKEFNNQYSYNPTDIFSSPGRIELLGNHTDHNNGKVLVSSVNLDIQCVASKRDDNIINFYSIDNANISLNIHDLSKNAKEFGTSISIIRGVLSKLNELNYHIGGFDAVCVSNIPVGAGVSSSAAFELLICEIENYYYNNNQIDNFTKALVGQYAEVEYFGKPCGLLDQTGISFGGINYIDFKDNLHPIVENIQIDIPDYQFILINTGGSHENLTPAYASIKEDMNQVSKYFNKSVLREVNEVDFYNHEQLIKTEISERAFLRSKHFFEENNRVTEAYNNIKNNNIEAFLKNITESGLSSYYNLKNCYVEKESEKLPQGLLFIRNIKDSYSRVHGGGFAGTALFICKKNDLLNNLNILYTYFNKEQIMLVSLNKYGTRHVGVINYDN